MIRHRAGQRVGHFDRPEAIHRLAVDGGASASGEPRDVADVFGIAAQDVRVERENHGGVFDVKDRLKRRSVKERRCREDVFVRDRLVGRDAGLREPAVELLQKPPSCRVLFSLKQRNRTNCKF